MERKSHKGRAPRPLRARIMESIRVDPDSGCWVWQKSYNGLGYGKMWIGSRADGTRRTALAHRVAYEVFVGDGAADELVLDHLCRNPPCVNPKHLEPVTQRENLLRGDTPAAKNLTKTHCPQGHEYSPTNTRVVGRKRYCITCHRESMKRSYRRAQ